MRSEGQPNDQWLEAIFDGTPVGLAVVGPDLKFRLANPTYRALTPDPQLDPVGRLYTEVWRQDNGEQGLEWVRQVLAGGEHLDGLHEVRQTPGDGGHRRAFACHMRRLSVGADQAILITLRETTLGEELAPATQRATDDSAILDRRQAPKAQAEALRRDHDEVQGRLRGSPRN